MTRRLLEFEGVRSLWRVPAAGLILLLTRGLPIFAAVVIALITVSGRVLQAALSAAIALVFDALGTSVRALVPWRAPLARRLWIYEKPNPRTYTQVLVRAADVGAARAALRRARLNPESYGLPLGTPPHDAPELDYRIGVHEPEAWQYSTSDKVRIQRIAGVLDSARIRARVAGVDVRG